MTRHSYFAKYHLVLHWVLRLSYPDDTTYSVQSSDMDLLIPMPEAWHYGWCAIHKIRPILYFFLPRTKIAPNDSSPMPYLRHSVVLKGWR